MISCFSPSAKDGGHIHRCFCTYAARWLLTISNPVTDGSIADRKLFMTFAPSRRSVDVLSTDAETSDEGGCTSGGDLWDSSDRGDTASAEHSSSDSEVSTHYSGSLSASDVCENGRSELPRSKQSRGK
jgi:hypothetical protein